MAYPSVSPLRDAFLVPEGIELRAFTHGLMPRTVPAMMQHFVDDWQARGVDAWNEVPNHWRPDSGDRVGWWTLPEYLGDAFIAPLLGVPAGTCIMQPNAHWVMQCLLSSDELFQRKRRVVYAAGAFPSVAHTLMRWQNLRQLDLHEVPPNRAGFVDRDALLRAIDNRTQLVVLSHVNFLTGERLPDRLLRAAAETAHRHGALLAVDGYHSLGATATSVASLGIDVYFGGLLKEGSGSTGAAFVYLRPGLTLTPAVTGWFGDADPFGFHAAPAASPEMRRRFLGGTTAIAPLYHAVEGVRILLNTGLTAVARDTLSMGDLAIALADEIGLALRSPREQERRGAMLVFELQAADRAAAFLKRRGIYVDSRQGRYLRLAPFLWNDHDEIRHAFALLRDGLKGHRYLKEPDTAPTGPVT